jgi:hypothetical protein
MGGDSAWEVVGTVAVVLSALIAAGSLGYSAVASARQREKDNAERQRHVVTAWQRAVVFEILHKDCATGPLTFADILNKYRSEAVGADAGVVMPENLSPHSLRYILLELIFQGAVVQKGPDLFALKIDREDAWATELLNSMNDNLRKASEDIRDRSSESTERMYGLMSQTQASFQTMTEQRNLERDVVAAIRSIVLDNPSKYRRAELILAVMERTNAPKEIVVSCVMEQLSKGEISTMGDGTIGAAKTILG